MWLVALLFPALSFLLEPSLCDVLSLSSDLIPEFQVTLVPVADFLDPHSLLSICWSLQASPVHGLPSQPFEYWFLTSPCSSLHLTFLVSV